MFTVLVKDTSKEEEVIYSADRVEARNPSPKFASDFPHIFKRITLIQENKSGKDIRIAVDLYGGRMAFVMNENGKTISAHK